MNTGKQPMQRFGYKTWMLAANSIFTIVMILFLGCLPSTESPPSSTITHVVLISIDTCRADRLGCYGRNPSFTPHLDQLAQDGILFENVVAPAPLTLPSHCTMLTGTIPPFHGVRYNGTFHLREENVTLAEFLKEKGFDTAAIVSAFVLDSRYGLDQGFDEYNDQFDRLANIERKADETTQHAIHWLEQRRDQKGFLFLHYFDPHMEYEAPAAWNQRIPDDPYLAEIAYTDHCIGQVIAKLKELGIYDSTLLMITSDHGEMLGEHGEVTHTYYVYQGVIRVPWIMKLPGTSNPQRIDSLVGVVDVAPTICGALGFEMSGPVQGMDLSKQIRGEELTNDQRPQFCESVTPTKFNANPLLAIVRSHWKYIHTTRPELYDLTADPGEENNLVDRQPDRADELLSQLEEMLRFESPHAQDARFVQSDDAAHKLTGLGYVGGGTPRDAQDFLIDPSRPDPKETFRLHYLSSQVNGHVFHEEYERAELICEELLALAPQTTEVHYLAAQIASAKSDHAKTIRHLSKVIDLQPDSPVAHHRLARALWELGKPQRAIESYQRALEIHPMLPEAHGDLGFLLLQTGQPEKGLKHLRQAVELKPESSVAHRLLADALAAQQDYDEAQQHYHQAVESDSTNVAAHFGLARVLVRQGQTSEATAHLRRLVALSPTNADAHQMLGEILQSQQKLLDALRHFRHALKLEPDSLPLQNNVAWILATHPNTEVRQIEEALRLSEQVSQRTNLTNPHYLDTLAAAYANAEQYEQAVTTAQLAIDLLTEPKQQAIRQQITERLKLYEQEQAFRESSVSSQ